MTDRAFRDPDFGSLGSVLGGLAVFVVLAAGAWALIHQRATAFSSLPATWQAATAPAVTDTLVLRVDALGETFIGDQQLGRAELIKALRQFQNHGSGIAVRIQAPAELKAQALLELMRTLKAAGVAETSVEITHP